MNKIKYLNVGCGSKFHLDWYNVDMESNSEHVIKCNLLNGIPFPDNHFEVVYHSQVLEHIPKEDAEQFITECFRVLKPGGIIRVVVPNLENIVNEYLRFLNENLENSSELSNANYDWIMLEFFDQTVRNYSGGLMAEYFKRPTLINEDYVISRSGFVGQQIRNAYVNNQPLSYRERITPALKSFPKFKNLLINTLKVIYQRFIPQSKAAKIGKFRLAGEVHMWMYDRYSLSRLLTKCGFINVKIKSAFTSDIPNWSDYELDVKNGLVYDPTSLFVEATKLGN